MSESSGSGSQAKTDEAVSTTENKTEVSDVERKAAGKFKPVPPPYPPPKRPERDRTPSQSIPYTSDIPELNVAQELLINQCSVFLSYDAKDREFAKKLHAAIAVNKRVVWVEWKDKEPSEDWMDAVYKGIERHDVFLFVTSPDSISSEMRNWELDHALKHGKRIIPIMCRDVDYREVRKELTSLTWMFFREDKDDFNAAVKLLLVQIDADVHMTRYHTRLLMRAIEWDEAERSRHYALKGAELQYAQQWLLEVAQGRKPHATELHLLFIASCISKQQQTMVEQGFLRELDEKKDMEGKQASLMISYSRKDKAWVRQLYEKLNTDRDIWIDWEDQAPNQAWLDEIHKGIERSDVFVYILSPNSIVDETCNWELDHALLNGKRIVPIVCEEVDFASVRPEIAALNWMYLGDTDFSSETVEQSIKLLFKTFDADLRHLRNHTKVLARAILWESQQHSKKLLLTGDNVIRAQQWLCDCALGKRPPATKLHLEFVAHSSPKDAVFAVGALTPDNNSYCSVM